MIQDAEAEQKSVCDCWHRRSTDVAPSTLEQINGTIFNLFRFLFSRTGALASPGTNKRNEFQHGRAAVIMLGVCVACARQMRRRQRLFTGRAPTPRTSAIVSTRLLHFSRSSSGSRVGARPLAPQMLLSVSAPSAPRRSAAESVHPTQR